MAEPVQSIENIFAQLSPADELVLISLPYRVGLFVSFADITGGWDAQETEMQSLTGILREFTEDYCKSEFAQKILMESMAQRTLWPSWSQGIDTVPADAARMMSILTNFFTDKELHSVKEILVDIALSVAMAFRENENGAGEGSEASRFPSVRDILTRLTGSRNASDPLEHMNVSPNERAALVQLCAALNYTLPQK